MKDIGSVLFEHCKVVINTSTMSVNSINMFLLVSGDVRCNILSSGAIPTWRCCGQVRIQQPIMGCA